MGEIFPRAGRSLVNEALTDTRGVFLMGARQVGKSTLMLQIAESDHPARVLSFDNKAPRDAAREDPEGFIAGATRPLFLDEIQRATPDLLLAIKSAVDRDSTPGQFLLTGSANIFRSKKVIDALTGRMEVIELWPLTQSEIEGTTGNCVDWLFASDPPSIDGAPVGRVALRDRVSAGGYPEARIRSERRRARWFQTYLRSTLETDLPSVSGAHKLEEMPRLLKLLATQAANLLVPANISAKLGLDHRTVASYVGLLETIFLVKRIPAWRPNLGQREVKAGKAYIVDSGLLLHLLGANESRFLEDGRITGMVLENFVVMEILRHAEWSRHTPRLYHYRRQRDEVDLVLEDQSGAITAVEVKSKATISKSDWRVLAKLRESLGHRFRCGVVFYTGAQTVPLGDRLFAVPVSGLWA